MATISIKNASGLATVDTLGAKINALILNNQTVLSAITRGDGKTVSSHPCSPIFGPETSTNFGLPQHGPMRNSECNVEAQTDSSLTLSCSISAGTYPTGLTVTQKYAVADTTFKIETEHTNNGQEPMPVNFAEHFYWCAPHGFEGTKINGRNVTDLIATDKGFVWQDTNTIVIPGLPKITVTQQGLPWCQLWVYRDQNGNTDTNYVCIEPAEGQPRTSFFGSEKSLIEPKQTRKTSIGISI